MLFNQFTGMPYIPYKIFNALLDNDELFKLLYYNTYDALSKPNLTTEQKMGLLWRGQSNMQDYNIFLANIQPNIELKAKTILKCYRYSSSPKNPVISTLAYRFDILFGTTIPLVEYNGITCNRGDIIEMELMKSLNGKNNIAGVGGLQYNRDLSMLCGSTIGLANDYTFTGISVVMATQLGDIEQGENCE